MATEVVKTVKPGGGGDYASLAAWESGEARDLVAADEIAVAEVYPGEDTNVPVDIGGTFGSAAWNTDADRYIEVRPADGAGATVPWSSSTDAYILLNQDSVAYNVVLGEPHTKVRGIQLENANRTAAARLSATGTLLEGCHIRHGPNASDDGVRQDIGTVRNCFVDGQDSGGTGIYNPDSGGEVIQNNTVVDCGTGILYQGESEVRNNLVFGSSGSGFSLDAGSGGTQDFNASGDGTAPGANSLTNISDPFVDSANGDYHLASGSAPVDAGTDLSGTFTDDFDGETRDASWDIGADELVSADTTESISATLAGTSTDSVGQVILNIVQSSTLAGTSTDSASPQTTDAISASLDGASSDSATTSLQERIAATLAGTSTDTADPLAIAALVATLDGLSTDSASPTVTDAITATLTGTSTDSGAITLGGVELLAATLAGTSLDSGAISKAVSMSSTLSGTSTDTGDILATAALISTLAGTSTDSATPSVTDALSGTLAGTSDDSALATLAEALSASLQGTSTDSGTISLGNVELMMATLAGVSSDSGAVDKAVDLSGTLAGTSSDTAAIQKLVDLLASLDGVSTDSGAIQTTDALTASLTGTSSDSASPSLTDLLNATLAGTSSDSAAVTLGDLTLLTATLAGTSTDSAAPSLTDALAAELAGTSTDTASARRTLALLSTLAGTSSDTGIISLSEVGAALDSDTTALVLKHADATTLVLMNSDSTLMQRLDEGDSEWPT